MLLGLSSCGLLPRPAPEPVPTVTMGPEKARELVVFLPGRWSQVEEFEREGFFEIARERWPEARLVAADLHLGYYRNQSGARRIHEDIISPARRNGTETVRVVGISMGGLGGLIQDLQFPGDVDELYLLSPFVGEEEVVREIQAAGGVRNWNGSPEGPRDFSRRLWQGLKEKWIGENRQPATRLACGTGDRLAASNQRFAADFLDRRDTLWQAGDHDWPTWRRLFREMIR
jgi:pimeloyl-ACP methyl ester carboxylesterase